MKLKLSDPSVEDVALEDIDGDDYGYFVDAQTKVTYRLRKSVLLAWITQEGEFGGGGAPAAHAASHATGGTDPITPASIGAATVAENAAAANAAAAAAQAADDAAALAVGAQGMADNAVAAAGIAQATADTAAAAAVAAQDAVDAITPASIGAATVAEAGNALTAAQNAQNTADDAATAATAAQGTADNAVAAAGIAQATADGAATAASTHSARTDNPHSTTAAQVGADPKTTVQTAHTAATLTLANADNNQHRALNTASNSIAISIPNTLAFPFVWTARKSSASNSVTITTGAGLITPKASGTVPVTAVDAYITIFAESSTVAAVFVTVAT